MNGMQRGTKLPPPSVPPGLLDKKGRLLVAGEFPYNRAGQTLEPPRLYRFSNRVVLDISL